jgi:hypothetical protein
MEQTILDPSKYTIKLYSLDSRFASHRAHSNGEFKINLPHTLKNIMRLRLASSEIPFVEYEFSEAKGNTTLAVRVGTATTYTKCTPIPDGNYTAADLMDAIQDTLQVVHPNFTCTYDSTTGLVTIQNSSESFSLFLTSFDQETARRDSDWGLGYNLGFEKGILNAEATGAGGTAPFVLEGSRILTLQTTQYYLLQLEAPDSIENVVHPTKNKGFLGAFAKLLLKDNHFTVSFDDNSNLLRKEYTFLAPATIPFFTCRLLNAWGKPVDMQDMEWSLTLEITEIVNSKTYSNLSRAFSQ